MPEPIARNPVAGISEPGRSTILGPSVALHGELAGDEDLVIEGQFDGTLHLGDHCVTVGAQGQVKAEIQATRVIVEGAVTGNITARERIEIRKTGRVLGDLIAAGIAIEDGAYFKGSIEILREESPKPAPAFARAEPAEEKSRSRALSLSSPSPQDDD
ncbi:MAG: polymer-forming cytoskeletal protein [Acidobacteria bacterium]|nr:polymer-forming cytoskeletal protein [Acidobacteriota bacterium]